MLKLWYYEVDGQSGYIEQTDRSGAFLVLTAKFGYAPTKLIEVKNNVDSSDDRPKL
jgi:hypothetical protein